MIHGHLPDQWAFSKETAFRIPQLMSELQDDILWQTMKCISDAKCRFIRRVLTSCAEQRHLNEHHCPEAFAAAYQGPRMLFEFTFSEKFESLHIQREQSKFAAFNALLLLGKVADQAHTWIFAQAQTQDDEKAAKNRS